MRNSSIRVAAKRISEPCRQWLWGLGVIRGGGVFVGSCERTKNLTGNLPVRLDLWNQPSLDAANAGSNRHHCIYDARHVSSPGRSFSRSGTVRVSREQFT